jgi:CHASE2 domain-containing sensor protein
VTKSDHTLVKGRRLVLLCGVIPAAVTAILALYRPGFLTTLDYAVYDSVVRRAAMNPPSGQVVIVDVDERSLSAFGQWPWRRDLIGRMIARIRELGAVTIALDVMFAEPDRHERSIDTVGNRSPDERRSSSAPSEPTPGDAVFAEVLRQGRVVLGDALTFDGDGHAGNGCVLHPIGLAIVQRSDERAEEPFFRASGAICSLPILARAAGASGFLNATPDPDGILRRVPLLLELDGHVYPGLALAAVTAAKGAGGLALRIANVNTVTLSVGDQIVPLDGKSNLLLRYRGRKKTFQYVSAADVLDGEPPPDTFRNKLVLVGATALGTRDVVATPFDTLFTGVEVQATVADNLLRRDPIRRPESAVAVEAQTALFAGVSLALLVGRAGLFWGSLGGLAWLTFVWSAAVWLVSTRGVFLSPLFPTVGLVCSLGPMTLAKVLTEGRRAEREGLEKNISQQLMVQTLLSLTEVRDEDTGRHSRRTQRFARLLAEQLAPHPMFRDYLTPQRIDLLARLAPLHDIGKVGVPDRLLHKPGALTGDEREEMKKHPARGYEVIVRAERDVGTRGDSILAMAKEIVYTHHERWDGSGYPQGLRGAQIPIPGRLMALVDVYDALVSKRVYRDALSPDEAIQIIVQGRGTHFDPAVVDAFLHVASSFTDVTS